MRGSTFDWKRKRMMNDLRELEAFLAMRDDWTTPVSSQRMHSVAEVNFESDYPLSISTTFSPKQGDSGAFDG